MIVCCFIAPGGFGALTRETDGKGLPDASRPWRFYSFLELRSSGDDLAAMRLIKQQGYCLFRYLEPSSTRICSEDALR